MKQNGFDMTDKWKFLRSWEFSWAVMVISVFMEENVTIKWCTLCFYGSLEKTKI